MLPQVLDSATG